MKIAAVQFFPKFKDLEANYNYILEKSKQTKVDLICFPELALSGYFFFSQEELKPFALDFNSELVQKFQDVATSDNKIILFGFPEKSGDNFFNSCAILFPDKKLSTVYRKTHLFYRERFIFTPGNTGFFVIYYPEMDLNLGTMICYDWRFPEAARILALQGADLIACPSNLVTKIWFFAMPARAIENKVFLLVANRIGSESNGGEVLHFNGKSAIWDYFGNILVETNSDDEMIIETEIFPQETRNKQIDQFNNIFSDRRPEMYHFLTHTS